MGDMTAKRFHSWLKEHTNNATTRELAYKIGTSHTTLGRQFSGASTLDVQNVIKLARAYDLNVLEALVVAGFITEREAGSPDAAIALTAATDVELARELLRRAEAGDTSLDLPVSAVARIGDDVVSIPGDLEQDFTPATAENDFSRRGRDFHDLPYVAGTDDSEDELDRD